MAFGGSGYIGGGSVSNAKIRTEASDNNCVIYSNTPNLRTVYRGDKDSGVQLEPEVIVSVPHSVSMQRCQRRGAY